MQFLNMKEILTEKVSELRIYLFQLGRRFADKQAREMSKPENKVKAADIRLKIIEVQFGIEAYQERIKEKVENKILISYTFKAKHWSKEVSCEYYENYIVFLQEYRENKNNGSVLENSEKYKEAN